VTLVPPVLVTVSERDCLFPTVTLPKLTLAGLAETVPAETPVPDNGRLSVELEASDVRVTVPFPFPVV